MLLSAAVPTQFIIGSDKQEPDINSYLPEKLTHLFEALFMSSASSLASITARYITRDRNATNNKTKNTIMNIISRSGRFARSGGFAIRPHSIFNY